MHSFMLALMLLSVAAPHARENTSVVRAGTIEIRRTTDDIPHIRAANWRDLGFGYGYAQAQDALCTLADAFVTYEGRRSFYFGREARPELSSSFGRAQNIDLDFFFRAFVDDDAAQALQREQPADLAELIEGFADGYNAFLRQARAASPSSRAPHDRPSCLHEEWVREIDARDIFRRVIAANLAAGYLRFVSEMVRASPPRAQASHSLEPAAVTSPAPRSGGQEHLGSNMLAFGGGAGRHSRSVLLGNPHWYWGGPDRFYQAHLTIPGVVNVAGVSLLGFPVIMIGFNANVAWSHTVSTARRFGLFALDLTPGAPTRYRLDGRSIPMRAQTITVEVAGDGANPRAESRALWRTQFGPVVNLERYAPALGWSTKTALAIRDINTANTHALRNFFYWSQARSLADFMAIQRREAGMPWVNTVAIARGESRVWYSDIGAVPNVSDEHRERCAMPLAEVFAALDAWAPVLDGTRSDCNWPIEAQARLEGAMPPERLPQLLREDYVANMNDSYWLSNSRRPLEGFAKTLGGERQPLSLRGREGHRIALQLLRSGPMPSGAFAHRLREAALSSRSYAADRFKNDLLQQACSAPRIELSSATLESLGIDAVSVVVDVAKACEVLRQWSNTALLHERGAVLWDVFWRSVQRGLEDADFQLPFDAESPLDTPAGLAIGAVRASQALGAAVLELQSRGLALDAAMDSVQFVGDGVNRVPLHGGCAAGYFTVICGNGGFQLDRNTHGNSYLQVVRFSGSTMEAHTLLAHGQHERALDSPRRNTALLRYAEQRWLRFPFDEREIERDANLRRIVLKR